MAVEDNCHRVSKPPAHPQVANVAVISFSVELLTCCSVAKKKKKVFGFFVISALNRHSSVVSYHASGTHVMH